MPTAPIRPPATSSTHTASIVWWNPRMRQLIGASGGRDAEHCDRDEAGHARDGVVHARRDAGVAGPCVCEHGRRQRRDRERETDGEPEQRGEEVDPVVHVRRHARERDERESRDDRPGRHEQARAELHRQPPREARQEEHDDRDRERRETGAERRIAGELEQEEGQEDAQPRERAVDRERLDVRDGEVAQPEEA